MPHRPSTKLDPLEQHFRIASHHPGLNLFLRYLPPSRPQTPQTGTPRVVLYVHGATFPSALSIAHRFDGRSWRDELADAGFHVWGLDFHGYGESDPHPAMDRPGERTEPLGRAPDAGDLLLALACLPHTQPPRRWASLASTSMSCGP